MSTVDRLRMRASVIVFAALAGYLGRELLGHGAFLGLLGFVAALSGGAIAAAADLESRSLTERRRRQDELFRAPSQSAPGPSRRRAC